MKIMNHYQGFKIRHFKLKTVELTSPKFKSKNFNKVKIN